ncbi:MAG: GAF domain-containing protein [Chloroflexi bacterium]|nr:GAF domain-containing protein [Chloroflexota bacterium]
MDPTIDGTHELEQPLERQMRSQERQLGWVRLGLVAASAGWLVIIAPQLSGWPVLAGVLVVVALYSISVPLLLRRFPAREVGIVSTAVEMIAVTVAVYIAPLALDAYLFYGLVVLGTALRFGFGASVWSAIVMSGLYLAVVLATATEVATLDLLAIRVGYVIGFGILAGVFSRLVIGRATENARLLARLADDEREREAVAERDALSRLGRDFGASLDRDATLRAIVDGAAPMLGDACAVFVLDDAERRLVPAAAAGTDPSLAERWRARADARRPRLGEGVVGGAAATVAAREGGTGSVETGDADGIRELELGWMLAVPILAGGRMLGVLACAGRAGTAPDERTRRLAAEVAERAGPALENSRLWSDLQDRMAREQAAQRIKDDFLSIVSHELRTPLTSIQGYSQLLEARMRRERSGESKEMAHLRVIRSQVGRMRRLVDDLLDVSRIDRRGGVSIEPVDFDLAEDLREAVGRVAREHPDREISLTAPEAMRVHVDRDRIGQVVSNLLENAVKYSPDGGPVRATAERRGGEVEVLVADAGVGIPAEHRDHVFERFYQADDEAGRRRFGGLGLGLYISRAIIDAHGGRIWVAPNVTDGRGSVFGFRIPRVAMPLSPAEVAPTGEVPPFVARRRQEP